MSRLNGVEDPESAEAALEERARAGDRSAQSELLCRSRRPLVAFCRRYVISIETAEDAAHDVLLAMSDLRQWPQGSYRAWLFRMARNRCMDLTERRQDGRAGAGGMTTYGVPRTGPGTAMAREEQHESLRLNLDALSPEKGEVLVLRYFDGLSRQEIAEVIGISEGLVRSRLAEARKELRRRMGQDE